MSNTAIGILLFAVVYGPVAYMVYNELTGRRSLAWSRVVARERHRGRDRTSPGTSGLSEYALSEDAGAGLLRR